MFKTIFSFEFNQWMNKPLFYIYAVVLTAVGAMAMAAGGGLFDSNTSTVSGLTLINSPLQLTYFIGSFSSIAFFLLPSIVGATVQKDFKSNMFQLLYSFPFNKRDYIFGKFAVGFLISLFIIVMLGLGIHVGTQFPGVDQNLIAPFNGTAYMQIYLLFVIPNLLLFSAIVFSVTLFTRSIIAGFIALAVLFFGQAMADAFLANQDYDLLGAYLDPFGLNAVNYYAKYWTITEQNENLLPLKSVVINNRIIWTLISVLIFAFTYYKFSFHQQPISLRFWKKKALATATSTKQGLIQRIELPKVTYKHDFLQSLKSAWALSKIDLKYILKGGPFIVVSIIGVLFIVIIVAVSGMIFQTETLPVTRELLTAPGTIFSIFIALLTFIYTGLLMHRSETSRIFQLEDATATKTWSFIVSKFFSVVIMQIVLLSIIVITGIIIQIYKGYYNFEIDLYLFDLYGVRLINYVVWAMLAFFVFSIVPNFYLGLFMLLTVSIGLNFIDNIGVEQDLYKYNDGPNARYSDMSKYGASLPRYYLYKLYWMGLGIFFIFSSSLFWRRGMRTSVLQTFRNIRNRFNPVVIGGMVLGLIMFVGFGGWIYYETNVEEPYISSKMQESRAADVELKYKHFVNAAQPRITNVDLYVDIFPKERNVKGQGSYTLINKSNEPIDSILVFHTSLTKDISLDISADYLYDSIHNVKVFGLDRALAPRDSLVLTFQIENEPNTILRSNTPIRKNGTFFNSFNFPRIGYNDSFELTDDKTRKKYGLEEKERMAPPSDSLARLNNYISSDADWIDFEAIVSTSPDQIAMTPGKLQKEWTEEGRRYFHYKMQSKMVNFYSVLSARYETFADDWNGVPITIYYHKGHDYNLNRIMKGAKAGLAYCSENFSPYQHDQLRILEFPVVGGGFAQSFANTVPFSEGVGFIADVDDSDEGGVDFPFSVSAHEVAHQWWAHQVIGAKVQGATVMSESLSEYVSLKVLEQEHGTEKMRTFLKDALDRYLLGRTTERKKEQPLAYNENQQHIHYNKGSLVFYALSDYIGEQNLNAALRRYVDSVGFQEPPYTTALELVDFLRAATPDSLQYFIDDMFLHITVYNNRIIENKYRELEDGKFEVSISAEVVKYRADDKGKRIYKNEVGDSLIVSIEGQKRPKQSFPLADYIEVGVFALDDDGKEEVLYLKKHKITAIDNEFKIIVDKEPSEVGIDPFNKLIDTNSEDNRRAAEKEE